jgi:hypothetical protein
MTTMLLTRSSSVLAAGLALLCAALAPEAVAQTCPSVSVAVSATPAVKRGGSLVYKATVTNHGPSTVSGFELAINTPALTTVRKTPGRGKSTSTGGLFGTVLTVPSLPSGKSAKLTLRLSVDKCAPEVLTIGAIGRKAGTLTCVTSVPDAVIEVKGDNACDNATPRLPTGFTSYEQISQLYDAYPQGGPGGGGVPSYVASGITCEGKYALCAFATCRIVYLGDEGANRAPLAECGW